MISLGSHRRITFAVAAITILNVALAISAFAAEAPKQVAETPEQHDARMKWFREARFGMFIHWGVYSVPAGEWQGKTNYAEWFLEQTKMPVSQYEKYAQQFNPVKFDAKAWVRMAKDAGMRYIVITSKHHDGFGMFRSDLTDWCIKSTPFQRDPLKELSEACREAGIKMCFYHSIMDWHHPDWGQRRPWNDKAPATPPDMDRYTAYMKGQLKELLTRYGPIGILWFDGEWEKPWTHDRGVDLYNYVRSLQPQIIINNRVGKARSGMEGMDAGKERVGDYGTPEQQIPATGFGPGVDWESCMTMNNHWGYNKHDQHWKSTQTLIHNLVDCSSKGGNYLLNIGPTSEGEFPPASIERLAEIGKWMKVNSESIYATTASPFNKLTWGRCTKKETASGTTLYLHVFDWPTDGKLLVPGLRNAVAGAKLLADGRELETAPVPDGVTINVPAQAPDTIDTVIVLEVKGKPLNVEPVLPGQASDGSVTLPATDAEIHASEGPAPHVETIDGKPSIGYWVNPRAWIDWRFKISKPARFDVVATIASTAAGKCEVTLADQKLTAEIPNTGSYQKVQTITLGRLEIGQPGACSLTIKPAIGQWQPMNIRSIVL
ncbi:MAG: alpha-L-fucosidase, partial [Sedimentisphaerales bacterium]